MQKKSAREILAKNIRTLRINKGFSQEVLANKTGLHRTYIGSVERGERNISIDNIEIISNSLEENPSELLENNIKLNES